MIATLHQPGLQTTIQDAGRRGGRHLGLPQSGAADRVSLALANAVLGNPWDAPALECTMTGPALEFEMDIDFAIAGAEMDARLNDEPVGGYRRIGAKPGDRLALGAAKAGARAYIAFAGGVAGCAFFNSVSTYIPAGLGGLHGQALRAGDVLRSRNTDTMAPVDIPDALHPNFGHDWILRATPGPDAEYFNPKTIEDFFSTPFHADRRGDRMGLRLIGAKMPCEDTPPMKSSAMFPGTVQCPPDGAPILLGPDAQTIGGYRRIAQVIDADLPLIDPARRSDLVPAHQRANRKTDKFAAAKADCLIYFRFQPSLTVAQFQPSLKRVGWPPSPHRTTRRAGRLTPHPSRSE
ncbi:MAG: biotin-dependent carboxyltransferase family protein [Alphaproteobacteria bacterium]|nr:biotin-dependent carboxyltransferase family protein [Alphaproteobacteria bacterium]